MSDTSSPKMNDLIKRHSETLNEIFEDIIEPILLEQQKISFIKNPDVCEKQLQGFIIAYRSLEAVALKGKERREKQKTNNTK